MDSWTHNSPLGGLAHNKTGRSRRETSFHGSTSGCRGGGPSTGFWGK